MTLVAIGYELSTSCTHCRRPLALNGAAESFACPSCQKAVETPQGFWVQILSEHTGECLAHDDGFAQGWTTSLVDYPFSVKGTFRRQPARCGPDCGSPFAA